MDDWEANWERDVLERIVVLLFALAGLADRAAGAPFLRRRQALGILSHGEVVARAFLIGMVSDAAIPVDMLELSDDAAHLAVRLRALALMLCVLLAQAPSPPPARPAGGSVRRGPLWVQAVMRPRRYSTRREVTTRRGDPTPASRFLLGPADRECSLTIARADFRSVAMRSRALVIPGRSRA